MKRIIIFIILSSIVLMARGVEMSRAEIIAGIKKSGDIYISNFDTRIKKDKEIVLIAVKNYGTALEYVDKSMQDDKEVVLVAVKENGNALKYASSRLKDDKEVVFSAVQNNKYVIRFASKRLQQNKNFLKQISDEKQKRYDAVNPPIKYSGNSKKDKLKPEQCWQYDVNMFKGWNEKAWAKNKYISANEIKPLEEVLIWRKKWTKKQKFLAVVVKTDKRIYRNNFFECHVRKGKLQCGGECDSGGFVLSRTMGMTEGTIQFSKEGGYGGPVLEMELRQKNNVKASRKVVVCPEFVHEGRYVCYDHKSVDSGVRYEGCMRTNVPCGSIRKRHFGHYATEVVAEEAFYRCKRSQPKQ